MTPDPVCHADAVEGCITCGDVAIEMTVVAVDRERGLALGATDAGERESVEIALISPEPATGDRLLVHAGTAISALRQEPAIEPTPRTPGRAAEDMRA